MVLIATDYLGTVVEN